MKCPEEVAGHDVGDDAQQHQEDRDPENPTVMHSAPARKARMISVVLLTMVSIVHTKQRKHITGTGDLGDYGTVKIFPEYGSLTLLPEG